MPSATVYRIHSTVQEYCLPTGRPRCPQPEYHFPGSSLSDEYAFSRMSVDSLHSPLGKWQECDHPGPQGITDWKEGAATNCPPPPSRCPEPSCALQIGESSLLLCFHLTKHPHSRQTDSLLGLFNQYLFSTHEALNIEQHFPDK